MQPWHPLGTHYPTAHGDHLLLLDFSEDEDENEDEDNDEDDDDPGDGNNDNGDCCGGNDTSMIDATPIHESTRVADDDNDYFPTLFLEDSEATDDEDAARSEAGGSVHEEPIFEQSTRPKKRPLQMHDSPMVSVHASLEDLEHLTIDEGSNVPGTSSKQQRTTGQYRTAASFALEPPNDQTRKLRSHSTNQPSTSSLPVGPSSLEVGPSSSLPVRLTPAQQQIRIDESISQFSLNGYLSNEKRPQRQINMRIQQEILNLVPHWIRYNGILD